MILFYFMVIQVEQEIVIIAVGSKWCSWQVKESWLVRAGNKERKNREVMGKWECKWGDGGR